MIFTRFLHCFPLYCLFCIVCLLLIHLESANATNTFLKSPTYYEKRFLDWIQRFKKAAFHRTEEYMYRLNVFAANDDFISQHNAQNLTYTLAHNEYSDLSWDEFRSFYKGYASPSSGSFRRSEETFQKSPVTLPNETLPNSIDWVEKGAVTHVKNQGRCGSCWAFSTTGAMEGSLFVQHHQLFNLSEQQLVDCDRNGNMGCNGGLMDHAFEWLEHNHRLCTEEDYAYVARAEQCRVCSGKAQVVDYVDIRSNREDELQKGVAKQPVSIAIEADQPQFQFYSSGVFDGVCGNKLDHGVLIVGYGVDKGKKFWKIKNSWGPTWGEKGYIRVIRDAGIKYGQCGLATVPSYPIAKLLSERNEKKEESLSFQMEKEPQGEMEPQGEIKPEEETKPQGEAEPQEKEDVPLLLKIAQQSAMSSASIVQCGNRNTDIAHFETLDVHPHTPLRGHPITFYGKGNFTRLFKNATFELNVKLAGVTVFTAKGGMCGNSQVSLPLGLGHLNLHGFTCPIKSKEFNHIGADVTLPIISPYGVYQINLIAKTDNDEVFCISATLGLTSGLTAKGGEGSKTKSSVYEELQV